MIDKNVEPSSKKERRGISNKTQMIIFPFFLLFMLSFFYLAIADVRENDTFEVIESQSEAHKVMFLAYKMCMKNVGGFTSKCQLHALDYGKARGFDSAQAVFNDIVLVLE